VTFQFPHHSGTNFPDFYYKNLSTLGT